MLYLATASGPKVRDAMAAGQLGQMVTPEAGNRIVPGVAWALDNGCFSDRWTPQRWLAELEKDAGVPGCLFAVVPDVVADADETDRLWHQWRAVPKDLGYPVAYVGQNGCTEVPADADALFIGGDDRWKLGDQARRLAVQARSAGLWVHMGRVNSLRRLRYAAEIGCDSVDGTYLRWGPDRNLPKLTNYLLTVAREPSLDLWRPA